MYIYNFWTTSAEAAPPYGGMVRILKREANEMPTYSVANSSGTILTGLERMDERNNDTRARVTDGMTESNGATAK
jgi:hypothetical protein